MRLPGWPEQPEQLLSGVGRRWGKRVSGGVTSSSVLVQVKLRLRKGDLEQAGRVSLVLRERAGQRRTREPAVGMCC